MVFTKCIKCLAIILIPIIIIILWTAPTDQPINFHADHGSFHIELNNSTVRFDVIDTGNGIYGNASNTLDFHLHLVKNITTYDDQDVVLKIY
jgi:hypothetical protein